MNYITDQLILDTDNASSIIRLNQHQPFNKGR